MTESLALRRRLLATHAVTAMALAGKLSFNPLTDPLVGADGRPFHLRAPKPAPEVPERNFATGQSSYVAPPADGSGIVLGVKPDSERIQLMEPWPAWDGRDFLEMPVLMKTSGKTTTDHISPAGPWLQFRGHLDRFSDNMLMGGTALMAMALHARSSTTGAPHQV